MHEDILVLLKSYNKKYNQLSDAFQQLQYQYDKTQFELKCIKQILLELCAIAAPHAKYKVQEMLDKHDKIYNTLHTNTTPAIANIRFNYQLFPDLGATYLWENSDITLT